MLGSMVWRAAALAKLRAKTHRNFGASSPEPACLLLPFAEFSDKSAKAHALCRVACGLA